MKRRYWIFVFLCLMPLVVNALEEGCDIEEYLDQYGVNVRVFLTDGHIAFIDNHPEYSETQVVFGATKILEVLRFYLIERGYVDRGEVNLEYVEYRIGDLVIEFDREFLEAFILEEEDYYRLRLLGTVFEENSILQKGE